MKIVVNVPRTNLLVALSFLAKRTKRKGAQREKQKQNPFYLLLFVLLAFLLVLLLETSSFLAMRTKRKGVQREKHSPFYLLLFVLLAFLLCTTAGDFVFFS